MRPPTGQDPASDARSSNQLSAPTSSQATSSTRRSRLSTSSSIVATNTSSSGTRLRRLAASVTYAYPMTGAAIAGIRISIVAPNPVASRDSERTGPHPIVSSRAGAATTQTAAPIVSTSATSSSHPDPRRGRSHQAAPAARSATSGATRIIP